MGDRHPHSKVISDLGGLGWSFGHAYSKCGTFGRSAGVGGYMWFNSSDPGAGSKFLINQGGRKNIAKVLSDTHDPPISKKMVAPNV